MKAEWQRHVLAYSGYIELGMFDEAAQLLEEIAPEGGGKDSSKTHRLMIQPQIASEAVKIG